jgi:hypothetical protein
MTSLNSLHINPDDPAQLLQWTQKFDVSEQTLREAIAAVGPNAANLEMHLKGSHSTTNSELVRAVGLDDTPPQSSQ